MRFIQSMQDWLKIQKSFYVIQHPLQSIPDGSVVKDMPANTGNSSSIPGSGRSSGEENGNSLQYPCVENLMERGTWWAAVHGVANSWTQLSE